MLLEQRVELRLLIGDAVCGALFVGRAGLGGGLLDQFAQIILDDLDAPIDLVERCLVNHGCLLVS